MVRLCELPGTGTAGKEELQDGGTLATAQCEACACSPRQQYQ